MISHTQAEVTVYRPDPDEMRIEHLPSHTVLHISRASRISVDDELFGGDPAAEAAAMRRLVALAAELAGELDRRAAEKPPAGETANAPCGPDTLLAPASSTRPDTQLSPGLSGHSPAGPDVQVISYLACGDSVAALFDPGTEVECPDHGTVAVVDRASWTALNPGDPIPPERTGGITGFVVGECGHRVAASEWRAGFRTCERCPTGPGDGEPGQEDRPAEATDSGPEFLAAPAEATS